ncbi:VWA domain-containing protein [uncultured Roseibium sp.]|uniref:VWA domain-containing protein n=1 Tax=uncultured Roseibium sp. TaxID=1936171 RepID=UPI002634C305|nr:VWA domain-containing protein [uncultured Roseibium sp.]
MSAAELYEGLSAFHFIRPLWLLLLPVTAYLWWRIRREATRGPDLPETIAPHLATALTVGKRADARFLPIDVVAVFLGLLLIAAAGPAWSRLSNPLVSDTAPLVVTLKVSKSMLNSDIPPSRMERSKHKILDLLSERAGAKTALVAYSGTAHQVVPPTEDPEVLKPFLEGLEPDVMPRDGNSARAALLLSQGIIGALESPGAIVILADQITDADPPAFRDHADKGGTPVIFWFFGREDDMRRKIAALPGTTVVDVTADASDVSTVLRLIDTAYREGLRGDERQEWKDQGWLLAWPAALLLLFWFRRGWTMQWAALVFVAGLTAFGPEARANGWRDWFLTPDQQGRLAFENKDYQRAANLFEDPMWKAYALDRIGRYEDSAEIYAWQNSADAAIGEGVALIKSRSYRAAIDAFAKAVERDPDNAAAQHNLKLAQYILNYIETTREQSDTGEDSGIGADDVVYDNEAGRGADSEQSAATAAETAPESAEQWMRTVDTQTGAFLKTRFALEAARGPQ